jgi:hypothetical protein
MIGTPRQIRTHNHFGRFLTSFLFALAANTVTNTVNSNQTTAMKINSLRGIGKA